VGVYAHRDNKGRWADYRSVLASSMSNFHINPKDAHGSPAMIIIGADHSQKQWACICLCIMLMDMMSADSESYVLKSNQIILSREASIKWNMSKPPEFVCVQTKIV